MSVLRQLKASLTHETSFSRDFEDETIEISIEEGNLKKIKQLKQKNKKHQNSREKFLLEDSLKVPTEG